jgi:hypothetical protein
VLAEKFGAITMFIQLVLNVAILIVEIGMRKRLNA